MGQLIWIIPSSYSGTYLTDRIFFQIHSIKTISWPRGREGYYYMIVTLHDISHCMHFTERNLSLQLQYECLKFDTLLFLLTLCVPLCQFNVLLYLPTLKAKNLEHIENFFKHRNMPEFPIHYNEKIFTKIGTQGWKILFSFLPNYNLVETIGRNALPSNLAEMLQKSAHIGRT